MTPITYAAYDHNSIYALGHTEEAAIQNARDAARDPDAQFEVAMVSDELAAYIDEYGWNGMSRSFELAPDGFLVDTTDH